MSDLKDYYRNYLLFFIKSVTPKRPSFIFIGLSSVAGISLLIYYIYNQKKAVADLPSPGVVKQDREVVTISTGVNKEVISTTSKTPEQKLVEKVGSEDYLYFQYFDQEVITGDENDDDKYIAGVLMNRSGMCYGLSTFYALYARGDLEGVLPDESFIDYLSRMLQNPEPNKEFFEDLLYTQLRGSGRDEKISHKKLFDDITSFESLISKAGFDNDIKIIGIAMQSKDRPVGHELAVRIETKDGKKSYDLFDSDKGEYKNLSDSKLKNKMRTLYQNDYDIFKLNDLLAIYDERKDKPFSFTEASLKMLKFLKGNINNLDFNQQSEKGLTYINKAIFHDDQEELQYLLENGADPNIKNIFNRSSLDSAVKRGRENMIELLLKHGAELSLDNLKSIYNKFSIRTYNLALERFLEINHKDGSNPANIGYLINKFISINNIDGIKILFSKGGSLDATFSEFPIEVAIESDNLEAFKLLLDNISDINSRKLYHKVPLLLSAIAKGNAEFVKLLLEKGADSNQIYDRKTPLSEAVKTKNVIIVKLLLKYGAEASTAIGKGNNDLILPLRSSLRQNLEMRKVLDDFAASKAVGDQSFADRVLRESRDTHQTK